MEKIFFVENGDLDEVNEYLKKGARVKYISSSAECVSAWGYGCGEVSNYDTGVSYGDIYAYIVLECL